MYAWRQNWGKYPQNGNNSVKMVQSLAHFKKKLFLCYNRIVYSNENELKLHVSIWIHLEQKKCFGKIYMA